MGRLGLFCGLVGDDPNTLDRQLANAPRAEVSTPQEELLPVYRTDYPHAHRLVRMLSPHDGAWWCHRCRQENPLVHRRGKHPFAHLTCGRCNHVFCGTCQSTQILSRNVMNGPDEVPVPAFDNRAIPYGMVCADCGLTHRTPRVWWHRYGPGYAVVRFSGLRCACGSRSDSRWFRFSICKPYDWHGDNAKCYGRAVRQRAELSVSQVSGIEKYSQEKADDADSFHG